MVYVHARPAAPFRVLGMRLSSTPRQIVRFLLCGVLLIGAAEAASQPPRAATLTLTKQSATFDCGRAALATLLSHYVGHSVPAMSLSEGITWREAEWRRIQSTGFSLQQLVLMAEAYGAAPKLIGLTTRQLRKAPLPLLVHLQLTTGPHFSVLTGMAGDRVTLADPSQGRLLWSLSEFLSAWAPDHRGLALAITEDPDGLDSARVR
jgi:predicted double-glycine peptidase